MRTVLSSALFLCIAAIAATAEPPPQAAVAAAPAITVADARTSALPAVMVSQVDSTAALSASSSTARLVDTPRVAAEKSSGHGMGFWVVIAALILLAGFFAWRWYTHRTPAEPASNYQPPPDRTRPPGSSGRST